jgi:uncharacterized protein YcfL
MKGYLAVFLASAVLVGCASAPEHSVQSTDPSQIFVGEEVPEGYPRTYIAKNGASCESVTESWVKDREPVSGKTMWRKVAERKTVICE